MLIPGVVTDLRSGPLLFDAKQPHCGLTGPSDMQDTPRVSVSVFSLWKPEDLSPHTWEALTNLQFNIPQTQQSTLDTFFIRLPINRRCWQSLNLNPQNQNSIEIHETTLIVDEGDTATQRL